MQRITKFSALIGFLAVMTFAIGLFMFAPSFTGHSFSSGTPAAFAEVTGGGGTGCSGCGSTGGFDHTSEHGGNGCMFNCTTVTQPVYPSCTISSNPVEVTAGGAVTISWSTTNAASVTLNGVNVTGLTSKTFHPTQNTTYTLVVTSVTGHTYVCPTHVTIIVVTHNNPVCTLATSDSSIVSGQSATLTWTTQNATAGVSLTDVGNSVQANGSASVSPTDTKTYTLTASGNGQTVTCQKTITVTTVHNPTLACNIFTASPSSLPQGGGNTQLSWTTTGASSVSIDQAVGTNLAVNDSRSVAISDNRTFTLTAFDSQGHSVSCNTSVSVDHGGGGGGGGGEHTRPSCTLFHTSTHNVSAGQKATLSWTTIRGSELTITDNRDKEIFNTGDYDEVREGSVDVAPTRDTVYTLTVSKYGKSDSCDVHVYADNNAGVTIIRDREPVTTITFRDVPYTGFDAGPILAGTFYALLAMWALVAAYVIVIQKGSIMGLSLATAGFAATTRRAAPSVVARTATAVAPTNLPVVSDEEEEEEEVVEEEESNDEEESSIQNRAFAAGVILSQDALNAVVRAGSSLSERLTIIDAVLTRAKESLPREDGWIALDRSRISALFN